MKQPIIEVGTIVFIIESNRFITEAQVLHRSGDFYTIRIGNGGAIKVRRSRLYFSREEAETQLPEKPKPKQSGYRSPYDFGA